MTREGRPCLFRAEDGTRDWSVTGVQTCALPISRWMKRSLRVSYPESSEAVRKAALYCSEVRRPRCRSEERRVGKECRYRWCRVQERGEAVRRTTAAGMGDGVDRCRSVRVMYVRG